MISCLIPLHSCSNKSQTIISFRGNKLSPLVRLYYKEVNSKAIEPNKNARTIKKYISYRETHLRQQAVLINSNFLSIIFNILLHFLINV